MNIEIDLLIIEKFEREQRERQMEESRRLWLPIPEPQVKPPLQEENNEPKRVIEIQL